MNGEKSGSGESYGNYEMSVIGAEQSADFHLGYRSSILEQPLALSCSEWQFGLLLVQMPAVEYL